LTITEIHMTASEPTMYVSPSNIMVNVNQAFEIDINISGVSDLYGWEFKLSWNPSLLEAINVTENSFLRNGGETYIVSKVNNIEGYILVGCTLLRKIAGVNGNGTIATVELRVRNTGSCTLDLCGTKLVSSLKKLEAHSDIDGWIRITPKGDADYNGLVEMADFYIWREYFGKYTGGWPDNVNPDFDYNGFVEMPDFYVWREHFGESG